MRVLILGGDGYLGWPTAMRFSARGHEVAVVDNFSRRRWHLQNSTDSLTPISPLADRVEATLQDRPEKEIATVDVGTFVMEELKRLDKVAYVRFASVYRHFRDINEFANELKDLLNPRE